MDMPKLPEGVVSKMVQTDRLNTHVLLSGEETGEAVIFLHGNFSAALYWMNLMADMPDGYYAIAPDIRGYGWTEDKITDATRGVLDWVEDLLAMMESLKVAKAHLVGWSLGAAPIYKMIIDHPEKILSVTLEAPVSPYGFGGTKGSNGEIVYEDFAGCGGGLVNPEFIRRINEGDRSADDQNSPLTIINTFYYTPPFRAADEEAFLTASLMEKIGEDKYPGDSVPSANWPFVGPGKFGPLNAGSPKYVIQDVPLLIEAEKKAPVCWIYGENDQIVSDQSMFDIATLGKLGFVPGYPGEEEVPPQPMISQTRAVFEQYQAKGGHFEEHKVAGAAHGVHIEKPEEFKQIFFKFLENHSEK